MATLDRLLIRGVRSFPPDRGETLQFASPLTLIVGHNGAGKTTIIECLKYATTGDLPPNSRSGAFIFDPKLAHTSEVKAQVKLRFRNVLGGIVTVTRSLAVVQRLTSKSQRTLDSLLSVKDPRTGEVHDLTSRCAVIDEELVPHLGVSKAVLDHVIFCHQEDSFWPLSEPALLKRKFDEIFASTRYTRVLNELKDHRKYYLTLHKEHERELLYLRANRETARKTRESMEQTQDAIDAARERIEALDAGEIDAVVAEMTEHVELQRGVSALVSKRDQTAHELEVLATRIAELTDSIDVRSESDDQLRHLLEQQSLTLESHNQEQLTLESRKGALGEDLDNVAGQISGLLTRRGQLMAEYQAYQRNTQERDALVSRIIDEHGYMDLVAAVSANVDNSEDGDAGSRDRLVQQVVQLLKHDAAQHQAELEAIRAELKVKEDDILARMQAARGQASAVDEARSMYTKQIEAVSQRIAETTTNAQSVRAAQTEMDDAEAELAKEESSLAQAKDLVANSHIDTELADLGVRKRDHERTLELKNKEIKLASQHAETHARYALKTAELERKSDMRQKIIISIEPGIVQLLGTMPSSDRIYPDMANLARIKQDRLKQSEAQRTLTARQLHSVEARLNMLRAQHQSKSAELQTNIDRLKAVCGDEDFSTAQQQAESDLVTARDNVSSMNSIKVMYHKFVDKLKDSHACPLCMRGFPQRDDLDAFVGKLTDVLAQLPERTRDAEAELRDADAHVEKLSKNQTLWTDCQRLRDREIPDLERQITELETQCAGLVATLDDHASEIAALDVEYKNAVDLKTQAEEFSRISAEIAPLERDVASLSRDMDTASGGSGGRTVSEIQRDIEGIQAEIKAIHVQLDDLNQEHQRRQRDVQLRENRVRDARERLEAVRYAFKERDRLVAQAETLRADMARLNDEARDVEARALELAPEIERVEAELAEHRRNATVAESEAQRRGSLSMQALDRLTAVQRDLDWYVTSGGDANLERCERETEALQHRQQDIRTSIENVANQLHRLHVQRTETQTLQRTIDDNLKLRQLHRDQKNLEFRITALSDEIRTYDVTAMNARYTDLKNRHEQLIGERAQLIGEHKQLEASARRFDTDLNTTYKDIERHFRDKFIDAHLAKLASNDIEVYARALDRAIMTYHKQKMDEVNKTIRELWNRTYRGYDIDTIEVRWDAEKEVTNTRSYNYRVVMLKGDTELDMRGRCSAGQKVLTSIIIRLALAETFGASCGILALDEPTTNLDRENVESLARALNEIIETRREQSNFQLIVITHDEEFMQLLGTSDFVDYYYRIEKLPDGTSKIEKQLVNNLN